jgi:capsular polysaccharide biosynthesis protein
MQNDNNLTNLFQNLKRWIKKIIFYSILAGILVGILSFFLPNYYKSTTVFYPANVETLNPNPLGFSDKNRYPFGKGDDVDRLMSIATSLDFKLKVIEKNKLADHYKMAGSDDKSKLAVLQEFSDLYAVKKNKYDAIELSYEDKDKAMSAKVANEARDQVSEYLLSMIKSSNASQMKAMSSSIKAQEDKANDLANTIRNLKSKSDIVQSGTQGAELAERLVEAQAYLDYAKGKVAFYSNKPSYKDSLVKYQAVSNGYQYMLSRMKNQSSNYSISINEIEKKEAEYNQLVNQLAIEKEKLNQLEVVQLTPLQAIYVIENANVPLKKSRPIRSLLVISSMLVVAFVTLAIALILESELYRNIMTALKES